MTEDHDRDVIDIAAEAITRPVAQARIAAVGGWLVGRRVARVRRYGIVSPAPRRRSARRSRARGPPVDVHCGGHPAAQLGARLFGDETRRTSNACAPGHGLFESARGGTLFLDEIAGLAPEVQDFRLAVLTLELPPLRTRGASEIARLAPHSVDETRRRAAARPARLTDAALHALGDYARPGNVRERRNVVGRAATLAPGSGTIDVGHLPANFGDVLGGGVLGGATTSGDDLSLRAVERAHVLRVLARCGDNKVRAARALGTTRATLYVRLRASAQEDAVPRAALRVAQRRT